MTVSIRAQEKMTRHNIRIAYDGHRGRPDSDTPDIAPPTIYDPLEDPTDETARRCAGTPQAPDLNACINDLDWEGARSPYSEDVHLLISLFVISGSIMAMLFGFVTVDRLLVLQRDGLPDLPPLAALEDRAHLIEQYVETWALSLMTAQAAIPEDEPPPDSVLVASRDLPERTTPARLAGPYCTGEANPVIQERERIRCRPGRTATTVNLGDRSVTLLGVTADENGWCRLTEGTFACRQVSNLCFELSAGLKPGQEMSAELQCPRMRRFD